MEVNFGLYSPAGTGIVYRAGRFSALLPHFISETTMTSHFNLIRNPTAALVALAVAAGVFSPVSARALPVIQHSPVLTAEQGRPLGLRATVHDTAARIESATLFYTTSKGSTPFRSPMTSSGAGLWYGTIPGHLVGPGAELFYYIQAENADGETRDTPWQTVRIVQPASGGAAAIPSAGAVADRARATAVPANAVRSTPADVAAASAAPSKPDNSKKYWVTAGIIAGGAVAVGGAIALSGSGGGGGNKSGGGGDGKVEEGTFNGQYALTFTPDDTTALPASESANASVYVKGSSVEIVGLWGLEIFSGPLSGSMFSAAKNVAARNSFPDAYLSVSASFSGSSCTVTVNGTSTDPATPGSFSGSFSGTRH